MNKLHYNLVAMYCERIVKDMQRNDPNGEYDPLFVYQHPETIQAILDQWKEDLGGIAPLWLEMLQIDLDIVKSVTDRLSE